jgi:hypothetical protein
MASASGPAATTRFHVWGQALYRIKPPIVKPPKVNPPKTNPPAVATFYRDSYRLLFAVSDEKQQWLGWYYFGGDQAVDNINMTIRDNHDELGAFSGGPTILHTRVPMTVEELTGPLLWSERNKWNLPKRAGPQLRRASIWNSDRDEPSKVIVRLHMTIFHDTGSYQFPINIKKVGDSRAPGIPSVFSERGFLRFIVSERYNYPTPHVDTLSRVVGLRHKLIYD